MALDSTTAVDGNHSARVYSGPITNVFCVPTPPNSTRTVGFTQFRQFLSGAVNFTDLTDSPNGFSFWFKLKPYDNQSGMAGFDIRVFGAESTAELDYAFNPDPSLDFANNTGVGSFLFHGYQPGQWYHFSRNLRADWLSMGLSLNHPFSLVMFEGLVLQNGTTMKSETFWLDDVRVYTGNLLPHVMISRGGTAFFGMPLTFTAVVSGGTSPYAYQWSEDRAQVPGATQSTFTANFSTLGPHSVSVDVTDANNASTNQTLNFNVEPPLVFNLTCNPNPGTTLKPVTCIASASGGAPPFTFTWAVNGNPTTGTGTSYTTYFLLKGTQTITATATDSNNDQKTGTAIVVIAPQPLVVYPPTCGSATVGKPVTCNVALLTGGTPPFMFSWSAPGGSPLTGAGANFTTTYSASGTNLVNVTATDANGAKSTATVSITVSAPPTVTISSLTPSPANTGETVTLRFAVSSTATVSGITVNWGDGMISRPSPTATSDTHSYLGIGSLGSQRFTINVTVTSGAGQGSALVDEIVNDRAPTVAITRVSSSPASTGQLVQLNFTASDPDGTVSAVRVVWGDGSQPDLILTILSRSMCPATSCVLPLGAIILVKWENPATIAQGTIIAFIPPGSPDPNYIVVHRVISIVSAGSQPGCSQMGFYTEGDANGAMDAWDVGCGVPVSQVLGVYQSTLAPSGELAMVAYATHTYSNTGNSQTQTFAILVNATDNSGSVGSQTVNEIIRDLSPTVASINVSPNTVVTGARVTVVFSARDADGTVFSLSINWGDGTIDSLGGTSTSDTHTYASAGSFTISITATDNAGSTSQAATSTVAVNPAQSSPAAQNPTIFGVSPVIFYSALGGITAIILILAALIVLRKKKAGPQSNQA